MYVGWVTAILEDLGEPVRLQTIVAKFVRTESNRPICVYTYVRVYITADKD